MTGIAPTVGHLFRPLDIRGRRIRNRVVWTAHDTNMADGHLPSASHVEYYGARAAGGTGLIIMEASSIHPTAEIHGACIHAYLPEVVPGLRAVAERVHSHGAALLIQLAHQGVHMNFHKNLTVGMGPSAVPSPAEREIPHVLDQAQIAELVASYATSALNAVEAGLDGVEVSASHSYLPAQFLSPYYNHRTDAYGGSLRNRMRFLVEILQAVRVQLGEERILSVRLSGEELTEFGIQVEDTIEVVRELERSELVDLVDVSIGGMHTRHLIVPTMAVGQGYQLPTTARIKAATRLPVIAIGRIIHPESAEEVLAEGTADLVAMTRAQIADPELAVKAQTGKLDEIRPCIGCNQACRERFFLGKSISCTVNPAAGRERGFQLRPAAKPRQVVVVGGGPAGLYAAVALRQRGHDVELHEASGELGGQALLAAALPGRHEVRAIIDHLVHMLDKTGVEVRLRNRVDASVVRGRDGCAVVLATGSRPRNFPTADYAAPQLRFEPGDSTLVDLRTAVREPIAADQVLVVDEMGTYPGLGVAELLADRGHRVTVCTSLPMVGPRLQATGDFPLVTARVAKKGVRLVTLHRLVQFEAGRAVLGHVYAPESQAVLDGVGAVIPVVGGAAEDELRTSFEAAGAELHIVGDCNAPRSLDEAFYEAHVAALRI